MLPCGAALLLAVLFHAAPPLQASVPSHEPFAPARIVGRVVDARTRAGIGSVLVRLETGGAEATTGPDGRFGFDDVAEGSHRLVAVLAGFTPSAPLTVEVHGGAEVQVEIAYTLGVTTEVMASAPDPPASAPEPSLGGAELSGLQVAAAVGGLDDVARVLQLRPGVAPSQDDRNDLIVRGGGTYETTVRMDGFELPTASHFAWPGSAGGGLSLIPSAAIARVSLETSGFSVAHGERASAVMDVEMKAGARGLLHGRGDATAGGFLGLVQGRLPGPSGKDGSWLGLVRRSILQIAFSRGDSRAVPSYTEAMGNVDLPLSRVHRLHGMVLAAEDGLAVDWQAVSPATITGEQSLAVAGVRLDSDWSPATKTAVSASWSSSEAALSEQEPDVWSFVNRSHEHVLRARAELVQQPWRTLRVRTGVAAKRSTVDFFLQDGGHRNEWNIYVPPLKSTWTDGFVDAAAYGEGAWTAGRVEVGGGIRADRSGITSSWYASPRVRLDVRPSSRFRLTTSWGEYLQEIPNIWRGSNAANRTLAPVSCRQTTVGVEGGLWGGAWVAVEAFWKRYAGYPIDPAVPSRVLISAGTDFESPLVGKLAPVGLVHADGVDTSFSQRLGRSASVSLGYSYWDVTQFNLEQRWIPADFDIRHQARAWLSWHGARNWTASALWRYASGRPYTPYDVPASIKARHGRYDRSQTNALRYPAYHRLDLRVERLWTLGRTALTAFAEVDNVYDRDNVYIYEWSNAWQSARPILQWGITPIAGVRIEF